MAKITHTIAVHPDLLNSLEVVELRDAGHTILVLDTPLTEAYRIFAPNAWRMCRPLMKYLPIAMKAKHCNGEATTAPKKARKLTKRQKPVLRTQLDGGTYADPNQIPESITPEYPPQ